ncbi:MAG TPA: hypothetical protein VMO20_09985 [Candidatus Acidoferrum sp.]|nr:hypothetical protein [Candidatus Acidoferrum sp.]
MKTSNLIGAALVALGIASQASADPVVYLTGSTAFRSTVFSALSSGAGPTSGGVFDSAPAYTTYGNSSASGGTYMIFHGNISGSPVYIDCAWSGSEAGIASACNTTLTNVDRNGNPILLNGSPETWLNVSNVTLALGGNTVSTNPASNSGLFEGSSHGGDLAQADTSQAISWTPPTPSLPQTELQDYGVESIVTFTLSKNSQPNPSNEWVHCSNITLPQLNVLFANGAVPAGFISGNPTDDDFTVYLVGRNLGSGTRMNMLGDSQYGAHRAVQQFSIGYGIEETPHQDVLVLTNEGDNGYESGGDVAKALGITNSSPISGSCQQADPFNGGVGWFAIGYLGPSDALNTGNFGGAPTSDWLTVDGVLSSNGAIENGSWWYWGHEHLYGRNGISGTANTVGGILFSAVQKQVALQNFGVNPAGHDAGIQIGLMNVTKASDVAFPSF